jgi:hypothetical protein
MTEHDQKQPSQSTGTGGGGNTARDKAPVPTAQAPFRTKGGGEPASSSGTAKGAGGAAGGASGVGSGLQPGGMAPTNERLAGAGRLDTPGAHSGPSAATGGQDVADREQGSGGGKPAADREEP